MFFRYFLVLYNLISMHKIIIGRPGKEFIIPICHMLGKIILKKKKKIIHNHKLFSILYAAHNQNF